MPAGDMDPEGLQRTLAELLAANRKTQENLDEIRNQFPIQPSNLSDLIPNWSELEEGGLFPPEGEENFEDQLSPIEEKGDLVVGDEDGIPDRLPVGESDQVLTADPFDPLGVSWQENTGGGSLGGGKERGFVELLGPFTIEKGEAGGTEKHFLVSPSFPPTGALVLAVTEGSNARSITGATFAGRTIEFGVSDTSGQGRPCLRVGTTQSGTLTGANSLYGIGAGPYVLKVTRSSTENTNTKAVIYLACVSMGQSRHAVSGGGEISKEDGGKLQGKTEQAPSVTGDAIMYWYSRDTDDLPTDRSDTKVLEVKAEYAEGAFGTCGLQLHFPTKNERETGEPTHLPWWQFPNEVSNTVAKRVIFYTYLASSS